MIKCILLGSMGAFQKYTDFYIFKKKTLTFFIIIYFGQDVELACLLLRPRSISVVEASLDKNALTNENYGSVSPIYCITGKDKVTNADIQRWMVEKNPPNEAKTFQDSDHMIMTSCPEQLFTYLQDISKRYN